MAVLQEKQLGRGNPGAVNTALYTLPAATTAVVKSIVVCNTSGSAQTYRVFLDDSGSSYTAATALFYDDTVNANETKFLELFAAMATVGGSLAVFASTTDVTFTVYGAEIT
jgi:hypothetical protein